MADDVETKRLMTNTLPQIFADIENSLKSTQKAIKATDERLSKVEQAANQALELAELLKALLLDEMIAMNKIFSDKGLKDVKNISGT
jgi:hypothetical protein